MRAQFPEDPKDFAVDETIKTELHPRDVKQLGQMDPAGAA